MEPLLEARHISEPSPPRPSPIIEKLTPRREKYINPDRAFKVIEDALEEQPTKTQSRWAQPIPLNPNFLGTKAALLRAKVEEKPTRRELRERLKTKSDELGALHPRQHTLNELAGTKVFSNLPAMEPSNATILKIRE